MNRKQYVLEAVGQEDRIIDYRGGKLDKTMPVPRQQDAEGNFVDDYLQPGMAVAGLFPVFGNFADLASAGIDVAQGQYGDAGLNVLAAVPGFGQFVTGTKLGAKAVGALGKAEKPVTALARASKSKPAVAASVVGPFAIPYAYDAMTGTPQDSTQDSTQQNPFQLDPQVVRSAIAGRRGSGGTVTPGTLQTFRRFTKESLEQTSTDITRCIMENVKSEVVTKMIDMGTGKKQEVKFRMKDDDVKMMNDLFGDTPDSPVRKTDGDSLTRLAKDAKARASDLLSGKTGKAALGGLGLAGIAGLPFLVRSMFGQSDTSDPQGQGSQAGPRQGDTGAMGGGRSIIDRLAMMYGYIPGFNPASLAVGALGKRVGAMA